MNNSKNSFSNGFMGKESSPTFIEFIKEKFINDSKEKFMTNPKEKFLDDIIPESSPSLAEIIKSNKLWRKNISTYKLLTQINSHNTNTSVQYRDMLRIYKLIYDYWYDYLTANKKKFTSPQLEDVNAFLSNKKYSKAKMSGKDCFDFIHSSNDVLSSMNFPIQSQSSNEPPIDESGIVLNDFIHCKPFGDVDNSNISCRLYLNIKPENVCDLIEQLLKKCSEKKHNLYFKFFTKDNRNDTFLIYTDYDHVKKIINILKNIKKENPQIFQGCEKINPILTNIDNFIGFSDEPIQSNYSFNLLRANAIDLFFDNQILMERKRIGNYKEKLINANGDELSLEEYLIYRLEEAFHETILNGMDDSAAKNYERNLPDFIKEQIEQQAKIYLSGLKHGKIIYEKPVINLPTKNLKLFPDVNEDYLKAELEKNGYLNFKFIININLEEELFSIFDSYKHIEQGITDEALNKVLTNHRISAKYPSLNIQSEKLLDEYRHRKFTL